MMGTRPSYDGHLNLLIWAPEPHIMGTCPPYNGHLNPYNWPHPLRSGRAPRLDDVASPADLEDHTVGDTW